MCAQGDPPKAIKSHFRTYQNAIRQLHRDISSVRANCEPGAVKMMWPPWCRPHRRQIRLTTGGKCSRSVRPGWDSRSQKTKQM